MGDQASSGWDSFFQQGLSALIDSQTAKSYVANNPAYNTQGGVAGQTQGVAAITNSPIVWLIGLALVAGVVVLAIRR